LQRTACKVGFAVKSSERFPLRTPGELEKMAGMPGYKTRKAWILILGFSTVLFVAISIAGAVCMALHIVDRQWYGLSAPVVCAFSCYQAFRLRVASKKPPPFL
jgi:hypothetical protein